MLCKKPKLFSQPMKVMEIALTEVENSTRYTQHILVIAIV